MQKLDDGTEVYTAEEIATKIAEANKALEANRDKAVDQAKAHKKALDALTEQWGDLDADAVRKMLADKQKADKQKAEGEGDWEALEVQLKDAHGKELATREARERKLMGQIEKLLVTNELTKAISASKGDAALLLPHAREFVQVRETDDAFEAFVVDGAGNPRFADGQGTPMTFEQLVETQLIEQYPRAFDGTGSSGSGASKSAGGAGGSSKTIAADDAQAFLANVEKVASGEVAVR